MPSINNTVSTFLSGKIFFFLGGGGGFNGAGVVGYYHRFTATSIQHNLVRHFSYLLKRIKINFSNTHIIEIPQ